MLSPSQIPARFQQGLTLHQQGRLAEAAGIYEEVLAANRAHSDALHWLGVIALQTGDLAKAADLVSRSLAINPGYAIAHLNLGNILKNLGRPDEALASYDRAIGLSPEFAGAHNNRGLVLTDMKRFEEALTSFGKAISLKPDFSAAHYNRGLALYELWRFGEAVESFDRAVALQPDYAPAHHKRATALKQANRVSEALAAFDRAIALAPDSASAWYDRGVTLADEDRFEEALASHDRAIALQPDFAQAHSARGCALGNLGHFEMAMAAHDRAIALDPGLANAYCNRAQLKLLLGDWESGLKDYEWRKAMQEGSADSAFLQPRLASLEGIGGKSVYVHWEQGLGDTLQYFRYVPLLKDAGARVLFAPQPNLKALLAANQDGIAFVATDDTSLSFDYQVPMLSLPLVFGTKLEAIPSQPYLFAEGDRVETWRRRIGEQGFRIGICWQGSSTFRNDSSRSFSLAYFERLSAIAGVRLISLHKGAGEQQLHALPPGMKVETLGGDFDSGPDGFVDTAAVMKCLDLVVTSDTSVAHLAGGLGVPVWLALQHVPSWRWLLHRADSPWYPAMRLFRQRSLGDWAGVFDDIGLALMAEIEKRH